MPNMAVVAPVVSWIITVGVCVTEFDGSTTVVVAVDWFAVGVGALVDVGNVEALLNVVTAVPDVVDAGV